MRALAWGAALAGVLLLPLAAGAAPAHSDEHPVGVPAPLFLLPTVDGQTYDLAQHLGRKPILLFFWSLFCVTCREDIPALEKLAREKGSNRVEVVGVNIDGRIAGPIREEMKARGYAFTSLMDEMSFGLLAAADPYGVDSTPVVFVIDGRGWVAGAWGGVLDLSAIREALEKVVP